MLGRNLNDLEMEEMLILMCWLEEHRLNLGEMDS